MGILSGLKSLGLGNLEDVSLFEEPKKKEEEKAQPTAAPKVQSQALQARQNSHTHTSYPQDTILAAFGCCLYDCFGRT